MLVVLAGVHLDFFQATDFGSSEHKEEKLSIGSFHSVSGLSWSTVFLGTRATSWFR